jgi:hypothetical protein
MYLFLALANVFAAIVAALVAEKKGYSAGGWLLLGLVFGVFALLAIAVMPAGKKRVRIAFSDCDQGNYRQCPSCKELVLREAERCKHCQIDLEPLAPFQSPPPLRAKDFHTKDWIAIAVFAVFIGIFFAFWLWVRY